MAYDAPIKAGILAQLAAAIAILTFAPVDFPISPRIKLGENLWFSRTTM